MGCTPGRYRPAFRGLKVRCITLMLRGPWLATIASSIDANDQKHFGRRLPVFQKPFGS
jgi:hypothetical protein